MRVMPGKPRVSPGRAAAFLCLWLLHQDVELTLMAFLFFKSSGKAAILVVLCASGDHGLSGGAARADANNSFGSFSDWVRSLKH